MKSHFYSVLLVLAFVLFGATSNLSAAVPEPLVSLPMEASEDGVFIELESRNGTRLRLLLDTGAEASFLFTHPKTRKIEFQPGPAQWFYVPFFKNFVFARNMKKFQLRTEGFKYKSSDWFAVSWKALDFFKDMEAPAYDGIIGYDFFASYVVHVDISSGFLRLYPSNTDLTVAFDDTAPLRLVDKTPFTSVTYVKANKWGELTARQSDLAVDTGFNGFVLLTKSDRPESNVSVEEIRRGSSGGLEVVRLHELDFAGRTHLLVPAQYIDSSHFGLAGLIGAGLLHRYDYAIDYTSGKLFLSPRDGWDAPYTDAPLVLQK